MKARRFICYHPAKKEGDKGFPKEIGTLLLPDEMAEMMDKNDLRIGVVLNFMPGVYMNAYPDRPKVDDDNGPF